ncbi:alpha/beta hydrolase-fold protein [Oleiagrimonas sp. C23AA]|uniref:alpha/beta hydrolase n=1 Tax=Oleiagrimonas sp. C23AA TaxID=2719047 RepID=UPI001F0EE052|nr:alpha/beta hydrolase-fold protein [Oleiagrimonas sp. C23AA]
MAVTSAAGAHDAPHAFFHVSLDNTASAQPLAGRLLVFAIPKAEAEKAAKGKPVTKVDANEFDPSQVAVAAREVSRLVPGQGVDIDTDRLAFPEIFSKLKPGQYDVQAVLDVNHNYNYAGRSGGDYVSQVATVTLGDGSVPDLTLVKKLKSRPQWLTPRSKAMVAASKQAHEHATRIDFKSPALTKFWGRPIHMRAWVLTPPGYDAKASKTYPTVYFTHGFTGNMAYLSLKAAEVWKGMKDGQMPPMIWVFLDESCPTGTHEFANSVNNGPWGHALIDELIPNLESRFHMDARARGRFLNGHSSGGWATLWLQTRYPAEFGGTWSTSPDPSDFHDFTGVNLYAPHANVYHRPDGSAYPLMRAGGKVRATFEQFAKLERVLGPYGGQIASFEWVFSPRGKDGRPEPMFNRDTGDVNPKVVAYWRDHYDIAHRLATHWDQLKPELNGKIHLYVGTADTFYLNGAARKLDAVLKKLHAKADIHFLPGRTHFDLYNIGDDRDGLLKRFTWQMYAIARPHSMLTPPPGAHVKHP